MSTSLQGDADHRIDFPRLTPQDIADLGEFSYHGIVRAIHRHELAAHKICGRWRVYARDVEAWIDRCRFVPDTRSEDTAEPQPAPPPPRGSIAALRALEQQRTPRA